MRLITPLYTGRAFITVKAGRFVDDPQKSCKGNFNCVNHTVPNIKNLDVRKSQLSSDDSSTRVGADGKERRNGNNCFQLITVISSTLASSRAWLSDESVTFVTLF